MNPISRRAFTLVELLVVVGIIAILVAILMPALAKARESSREVICASNMRQWGIGLAMYVGAYKGKLPGDGPEDGDTAAASMQGADGKGWESEGVWWNAIPPYVHGRSYDQMQTTGLQLPTQGENSVFVCPSTSTAQGPVAAGGLNGDYFRMYARVGATASVPRDTFICYAFNSKLTSGNPNGLKMNKLRPSSEVVVMVEKRMRGGEVSAADDTYYQSQGGPANRITSRALNRIKADWQRFASRHRKDPGGNLLFADGHVQFFSQREVLTRGAAGDMNKPGLMIWSLDGAAVP